MLNLQCVVYNTKSVAGKMPIVHWRCVGTHCSKIKVVAYRQRYHDILTLTISIMHHEMHTWTDGKAGNKRKWEQVREWEREVGTKA